MIILFIYHFYKWKKIFGIVEEIENMIKMKC